MLSGSKQPMACSIGPPPHIPIDTPQLDTPVDPAFAQSTKNVFKVGRAILERESWSQQRLRVSLYISPICKLTLHHTMHIKKLVFVYCDTYDGGAKSRTWSYVGNANHDVIG